MQNKPPSTAVYYTDEVERTLKFLAKKYRHIKSDIAPTTELISQGNFIGDRVTDVGNDEDGNPYQVFKVRIGNRDSGRGKRGGYRLLYWVTGQDRVIIFAIYSKSDQGTLTSQQIQRILKAYSLVLLSAATEPPDT
jgi:mRNA-degrading endonuclease RelE of RelBE toxin-antitoxin system